MKYLLALLLAFGWFWMRDARMSSSRQTVTAAVEEQELLATLRRHVTELADRIGNKSVHNYKNLLAAEQYITSTWQSAGFEVRREEYRDASTDLPVANLEVEIRGKTIPDEIVVIGAHYDSVQPDCPGANDNGSGVAAVLELARLWRTKSPARTVRFVAFVNEEPPHFTNSDMGSMVYAANARKRKEKIVAMVSLETIGYFTDEPESQDYPAPLSLLYPSVGNFIGFVSNVGSASLVKRASRAFRAASTLPVETASLPSFIPGIGWSDHRSFWENGFPAMMVTDTAPYRYPHYHLPSDTADKLDYPRFTMVVRGFSAVIEEFAGA